MAQQNYFTSYIENRYIGKSKIIKAPTKFELDTKVANQLAVWAEQERRMREKEHINDLKALTEQKNFDLGVYFSEIQNLLVNNLNKTLYSWQKEYKNDTFSVPMPDKDMVYKSQNVPSKSFFELFFKNIENKRVQKENEAASIYNSLCTNWNNQKKEFEENIQNYNRSIDDAKNLFESEEKEAICNYFSKVLCNKTFPISFSSNHKIFYNNKNKILIVHFFLPVTTDFEHTKSYKYVASEQKIKSTDLKPAEFNTIYNEAIKQIALSVITDLYFHDYKEFIDLIVFNGMIHSVKPSTGKYADSCIISVQMTKRNYVHTDFNHIQASACIKEIKGIYSENISDFIPIKPIMDIDRKDKRFINNQDVLDTISRESNLAEMNWEEFEYLIRELFEKYFSAEGAEVRVTQASRDGGVDAIAFDPDPIRGGKFVIQAKRYNIVVPVSAVRDLYGTMINEGAVKGILVTTSYFGKDSYEFAKDKPISLIDGNNLIYLLSKYGYNFQIKLRNS